MKNEPKQENQNHDALNRNWTDISSEQYRTYSFPNKESVTIDKPQKLNVSRTGGHRILDTEGVSHYIPAGWIKLSWKGTPAFVA